MSKPDAWIVDIDGTLFDPSHRMHMLDTKKTHTEEGIRSVDWPTFNARHVDDTPFLDTHNLVQRLLKAGDVVIYMTARQEQVKVTTREQLEEHRLWNGKTELLMRGPTDYRSDVDVKTDLYFDHVEKHYNVLGVLEDRESVVQMWRKIGLTCYQPRPSPY